MAKDATHPPTLQYSQPSFCGNIGIARRDITPPVGIYARNFAYLKDGLTTTGTHLPLTATAAVFRSPDRAQPLVLVAVDGSWFKDPKDEKELIRGPALAALKLDEGNLIIAYSHTHSGCSLSSNEAECPGGEHIVPYMKQVSRQIVEAVREAIARCKPATLTWGTGRCDLAVNRDQVDPDASRQQLIIGFDPDVVADDTLLVGRIALDEDNSIIGTILNYACHPITLGWQNSLASPDFVGPARALVEKHTGGAPCMFLQGASGELAPRRQYSGDLALVESNGRQLGYAALSTLEAMLIPRHALKFDRIVESGAALGVWTQQSCGVSPTLDGAKVEVKLPLKSRPSLTEIQNKIDACEDKVIRERLRRELKIGQFVGDGADCPMPAWIWRLGGLLIVAHPNEAYSDLQLWLRRSFPDLAVVVINVANGWCGYLPPKDLYNVNAYQVWQTPFAEGALEKLTATAKAAVNELTSRP